MTTTNMILMIFFFAELFDCTGEIPVSLKTYTDSYFDIDVDWFVPEHTYKIAFGDSSVIRYNSSEQTELPGFSIDFTYEEAVENYKPTNDCNCFSVNPGGSICPTLLLPIKSNVKFNVSVSELEKRDTGIFKAPEVKITADERGITIRFPRRISSYEVKIYAYYEDSSPEIMIGNYTYTASFSDQTRQAFAEFAQKLGEICSAIISAPVMSVGWALLAIMFTLSIPGAALLSLFGL